MSSNPWPEYFDDWSLVTLVPANNPTAFMFTRYLEREVFDWLEQHAGPITALYRPSHRAFSEGNWVYHCPDSGTIEPLGIRKLISQYKHEFWFANSNIAMIFKLTWGGC